MYGKPYFPYKKQESKLEFKFFESLSMRGPGYVFMCFLLTDFGVRVYASMFF